MDDDVTADGVGNDDGDDGDDDENAGDDDDDDDDDDDEWEENEVIVLVTSVTAATVLLTGIIVILCLRCRHAGKKDQTESGYVPLSCTGRVPCWKKYNSTFSRTLTNTKKALSESVNSQQNLRSSWGMTLTLGRVTNKGQLQHYGLSLSLGQLRHCYLKDNAPRIIHLFINTLIFITDSAHVPGGVLLLSSSHCDISSRSTRVSLVKWQVEDSGDASKSRKTAKYIALNILTVL